jgi:hypothetical protein
MKRMTTLTITLPAPLLMKLVRKGKALHGKRGVSKYLREVITAALG